MKNIASMKAKKVAKMASDNIKKLPVIFGLSVLLVVPSAFFLFEQTKSFLIYPPLLALTASFSITLVCEKFLRGKLKYAAEIIASVAFLAFGFALSFEKSPIYSIDGCSGIFLSLIPLTLFLFRPKDDSVPYFALVFKYFAFSAELSLVLNLGILLLSFATNTLFVTIPFGPINSVLSVSCYCLLGVNLFAHYFFFHREEKSAGKRRMSIYLYILYPVFALLVAILYVYLLQSLILRASPKGRINWFVSIASAFFMFFHFLLKEYKTVFSVKIFYKYGAFILLPLIAVQLVAFAIRINAYGLTRTRVFSAFYIAFSLLFVILTFFKGAKYVDYSLLLLSALFLVSTVTPFSAKNIAFESQKARLERVLEKYGIFDKKSKSLRDFDREALKNEISKEDRQILFDSFAFVKGSKKAPSWIFGENGKALSAEELFGKFDSAKKASSINKLSLEENYDDVVDITGFSKVKHLSIAKSKGFKSKRIKINGEFGNFDITDFVLSFKDGTEKSRLYRPDENTMIYIRLMSCDFNEDTKMFEYIRLDCDVFWK